jgi:hypothetical protein
MGGGVHCSTTVNEALVLNAKPVGSMRTWTMFVSTKSSFTTAVWQVNVSSFKELLNHETTLPTLVALETPGEQSKRARTRTFVGRFIPQKLNRFTGKNKPKARGRTIGDFTCAIAVTIRCWAMVSGAANTMRLCCFILLGLCLAGPLDAQAPVPPPPAAALSPDELDQLLAPIALYPDPLIALILPAASVPSDVMLAARYLEANGDPAQIPNQPWDDSVKSLAHYPQVVEWMDQNVDWTRAVGSAFITQQKDVMDSVQHLRSEAQAQGNLADTPQQQVDVDDGEISIMPAQPNAMYVPQYDPDAVYVEPPEDGPLVTFDAGWPVGPWLGYDCNWQGGVIWIGTWQPGWHYDHGWGRPWQPNPRGPRPGQGEHWPGGVLPRPGPLPGAPIGRGGAVHRSVPVPSLAPVVRGGVFDGSGNRGSVIREYSDRGNVSHQTISRPAAVFSRPASVYSAPREQYTPSSGGFSVRGGGEERSYSERGSESRGSGGGGGGGRGSGGGGRR